MNAPLDDAADDGYGNTNGDLDNKVNKFAFNYEGKAQGIWSCSI